MFDVANRLQLVNGLPDIVVIKVAHDLHEEVIAPLLLTIDRFETREVDSMVFPYLTSAEKRAHFMLNLHAQARLVLPSGCGVTFRDDHESDKRLSFR